MDAGARVPSFSASLELANNSVRAGAQPWASLCVRVNLWEKEKNL